MSRVMELYHGLDGAMCACGRIHRTSVKEVVIEEGAIRRIPDILSRYGVKKPFLLADANTWKAAGELVYTVLMHSGLPCSHYIFEREQLEPDERTRRDSRKPPITASIRRPRLRSGRSVLL